MSVAELERKFNPGQLRDPGGEHGGQWIKNPGDAAEAAAKDATDALAADELDLSWQIELNPGEQLIASNAFYQRGGDYELDAAIIKTHGGHEIRLGVTHEDESWPGDSVDTLHLDSGQFRKLHADLSAAAKEGKKAAAEADKAWSRGMQPTDPRLLGSKAVVEGVVSDGGTDLNWAVHVTDDDPTSWQMSLGVADGGELTLNPPETTKLLKFLQGLDAHIGAPDAARAYSQEAGPAYQPAAGPPKGGQFAKGGGRVTGHGKKSKPRSPAAGAPRKPTPPDPNLSFDGSRGTGYGIKGGDARVRTLQAALNRLGVTDSSGNELALDGRYGPRTTSSVKKLQKALGLPADGKVTPELLKQVTELRQLPPKPPAKQRSRRPRSSSASRRHAPARRSRILATVARALGEHRVVDGVCATCEDADDEEGDRAVRALIEVLDEISRVRYVRTEAGAKKYGVPIGTPIGGGGSHGPHAPNAHTPAHTPQAARPKAPQTPQAPARAPSAAAKPAAAKAARTTVKDRLVAAIDAHLKGEGDGKPLAGFSREQLRQVAKARGVKLDRGEHQDSIAQKLIAHASGGHQSVAPKAEPKPATPPAKAAKKATPAKRGPAKVAAPPARAEPKASSLPSEAFTHRSVGRDLFAADAAGLARDVVAKRDAQRAADHSLAVIGNKQGYDGKPRVVSKAEMDKLVADGHEQVFRGVSGSKDGTKSAAEIHDDMRNGHAWYGYGIYGNGYYWGDNGLATSYSDGSSGSIARAVLAPDAKVINFWEELNPEHEKFMASLTGHPNEAELRDIYGDVGRYAAARGYDAIRINDTRHNQHWFNVLNRTAMVVEEAQ